MKKILTALVLCMMLVVTCAFADNYSADVVIIGSGGAGMSAAIVASDAGASVVILEQMNYNGGNTRRSEGGMNAAETVSQKALGIEDSVDVMFEDTMKGGKNISNPELVRYLAENSAESIDWLLSIGMDMTGVAQGAGATNPRMHRSADGAKIGGVLVPVLEKNLAERGIRILYATKATDLVVTDGKVTGVTAVDANGNTMTFDAGAVVLATGGFGANPDIFVKYRPDLDGFSTTNHPGSNGSGIAMAQAIGADTVDMEQIQTNPTVDMNTNIVISETVRGKGAIFVNQSGERFVNEMLTRDVLSSAILELPEKYTYEVFLKDYRHLIIHNDSLNVGMLAPAGWLSKRERSPRILTRLAAKGKKISLPRLTDSLRSSVMISPLPSVTTPI